MTNSDEQRSKFNINIGQVEGGDFQIGDRYYSHLSETTSSKLEVSQGTGESDSKLSNLQKTILFLASSPIDQAKLRLEEEAREIDIGLRLSKYRDHFTLQQRWAIRSDDLRRALLDFQPQIVHFCGHGSGMAGLVLEDKVGKSQLVPTEALSSLFKLFASRGLECVLLNACFSRVQAEAIAEHIPHVIGMSEAIKDVAAIKFAIGFYDGLGGNMSYEEAYEMGRVAIALEGIPQDLIPVLIRKSD
ncbi:CHAT domain-containing protein [Pseudanabaena yagii]|uniref:CHAT domain-containing protein n=1 Tax=Pseudanabaena yagii GIHE-NHR1 TaxID=2722753 RepID=A0ABX1M0M5_9CYAN|nr:CHAT domain-containing protein [Pseudanabaena yagii]NMF61048.1 CHAT domain-containing protein [Pseudanabaena yagii GIHE-NHR1]